MSSIINQLVQQGVRYFCLAPGSRSTPLALAIAAHSEAQTFIHFDERGLAFHALGYAKATKQSVAVVVTSGTAVGNLFPAVMEASNDRVPLVLLTADRPPELRGCGANQTLDQVKVFGNYVRAYVELPCQNEALSEAYVASTVAHVLSLATCAPQGPVHINCLFREPFSLETSQSKPIHYASCISIPQKSTLQEWAQILCRAKRGVIIVGALPSYDAYQPLFQLAQDLGWPILADILSNVRSRGPVIKYYDLILKAARDLKPDCILHLGNQLVSKTLLEWLAASKEVPYIAVSDHPLRHDPQHQITHRLACDPLLFCTHLLPFITKTASFWMEQWLDYSTQITPSLFQTDAVTEPGIASSLHIKDLSLFIANSMPIRDCDLFFFPDEGEGSIFANRGVSGIDGNIATAAGIAQGSKKLTVALIGDQTALHDLNSLALLKKTKYPVVLVIINNHGGGIFSFVPTAKRSPCFEEYFAAAHALSFEKAAQLFDLPYSSPKTQMEWEETFFDALKKKSSCIIEVVTEREANFSLHQHIYAQVKPLCSPTPSAVH